MREATLDEQKAIQLNILDSIHDFCSRYKLRYSLCGGTLLGAVKQKGFIPFDDDIDIMMPREDYEQFLRTYREENNEIMNLNGYDSCRELYTKVGRKGTALIDPILGRSLFQISIDVCPVDGAPDNRDAYSHEILQKLQIIPKLCTFHKVVPKHKWLWYVKYCIKRIFTLYPGDILALKSEIKNTLCKYSIEDSPYAGELVICRDENDMIDSNVFKEYTEYEFEGRKYMGIKDYDTYLKMKYSYLGDYMNLPPLTKPLHEYTALIEDNE